MCYVPKDYAKQPVCPHCNRKISPHKPVITYNDETGTELRLCFQCAEAALEAEAAIDRAKQPR